MNSLKLYSLLLLTYAAEVSSRPVIGQSTVCWSSGMILA